MNRTRICIAVLLLSLTGGMTSCALKKETAASTFKNPVLWADVPDPDVIRVGDDFYLMSTTMHLMPGGPVMHSEDLVNWRTASYLFDRLTDSPKYDMQGGTVYGRGQWATSLKYKDGMFYALFAPNDSPGGDSYLYQTEDPKKEWTLKTRLPHFHDCSLFFDDDDRVYVFHGTGLVQELRPDLTGIKEGGLNLTLFERDSTETGLLEGSRVVKKDGKYYLFMVSWPKDKPRRQVCYRTDKLEGPWEKRIILEDNFAGFPYVGQGTIVDDADGNWYGIIFQDRGAVGRVLTLMPCRWEDGWPILGNEEGKVPLTMEIPCDGTLDEEAAIVTSDDFDTPRLSMNWQWNHNPENQAWSLMEHKGWLRLHTSRKANHIFEAVNTISQRMMGPKCSGTIKMDVSHMADGDCAGLSAFNGDAVQLTVICEGGQKVLSVQEASVKLIEKDKAIEGVDTRVTGKTELEGDIIYLRIDADFNLYQDVARLSYSLDGKEWTKLGHDFKMKYDFTRLFMGSRFAIFNYATRNTGGYVDIDYFHFQCDEK